MSLLHYTLYINIFTFFVYGLDKWKAKKKRWRISEESLILLAIIGGSIGAWCGMQVWRHKTKHNKFIYGIPFIIVCQLLILMLI